MKFYLVEESEAKLRFNIKPALDGGWLYEATPENIRKLNLIPKKEKREFQYYEEVAVYIDGQRKIGRVSNSNIDIFHVCCGGKFYRVHPNQCRKLINKTKHKTVGVTRELLEKAWKNGPELVGDYGSVETSFSFQALAKELGLD